MNNCAQSTSPFSITVLEKDENVGIFFGVDCIVTKLGIGLFFTTVHAPQLCRPILIAPALHLTTTTMISMPATAPLALLRQLKMIVIR